MKNFVTGISSRGWCSQGVPKILRAPILYRVHRVVIFKIAQVFSCIKNFIPLTWIWSVTYFDMPAISNGPLWKCFENFVKLAYLEQHPSYKNVRVFNTAAPPSWILLKVKFDHVTMSPVTADPYLHQIWQRYLKRRLSFGELCFAATTILK